MTTLLVLYRRPDGGPDAEATFERRYAGEHLPLVAGTPGLREARVQRVTGSLGGETDLALVALMRFDDRGRSMPVSRPTRCGPPVATSGRSRPGLQRSWCSRTSRKWMRRPCRALILSEPSTR